jgi:hypothetical protein
MNAALIGLIALAAASPASSADDPLAPARAGMIRCYEPEPAAKTCHSTMQFLFDTDGTIRADEVITLGTDRRLVMRMQAVHVVRDGMVCETMLVADYERARFTVGGTGAVGQELADLRKLAMDVNSLSPGHTMCTRPVLKDGAYRNRAFIDGKELDGEFSPWIWVDPREGWRVLDAPR